MAYKPIDQYGLIGDMHSAALVGTDGSIDWCCFPRFDSPSVFAAILDHRKGGRFQISPVADGSDVRQSYVPDTNILHTRFQPPTGELSLIDFMPLTGLDASSHAPHEIHRIVRCDAGAVEVSCIYQPRLGYARNATVLTPVKGGVLARGARQALSLLTQVPLETNGSDARARFTLRQGEEVAFVLAYGHGRAQRVESYRTAQKFQHTRVHWELMASGITYDGLWRDDVVRSFLSLHLMTYEPTGAIIASPTTSLPERIGGPRNWDYRYGWLRDSAFAMGALYRMGHVAVADRYMRWLLYQCKVTSRKTRIVYGISPSSSLNEATLDHLEGYQGSRPVRVGNHAARHLQMDVFGEVILGIETLYMNGGGISDEAWSLVQAFADIVCRNWHRKDRGVWEVRGAQKHFVYSKMMCWAALDRATSLATALGLQDEALRWRRSADEIKDEVLRKGWSESKQAFVQHYGSDSLDASNLVIAFLGLLPPDDNRLASTLDAIRLELADGPLVRRYSPQETDDGLDGEDEGAFTLLSFWLIGNLIYTGQIDQAQDYFEEVLGYANHLGLFSEMIDPTTKALLGNFPQAYSHIGVIHTARNLSRALTGKPARQANGTRAALTLK